MNEKKRINIKRIKSKYSLLEGNLKRRIRLLQFDSNLHLYIENEIESLPTVLFDTVIHIFFSCFKFIPFLKRLGKLYGVLWQNFKLTSTLYNSSSVKLILIRGGVEGYLIIL